MSTPLLDNLLARSDIWRGRTMLPGITRLYSTGFNQLDQALADGGWPLSGLVELRYPRLGSGEWQLLAGTLRDFSGRSGYLVLVNPPALLCISALAQMGVDPDRLLIVRCRDRRHLLAGVLESLGSGCAQILLFWEGSYRLRYAELRKIQLAAAEADLLCMGMRQDSAIRHSPAALQLALQPRATGIGVRIERQRGGAGAEVQLDWPSGWTLQPLEQADAVDQGLTTEIVDQIGRREQAATASRVLAFRAQG